MSRIVIKIGSNILTDIKGGLNQKRIYSIAKDISDVCEAGHEIVIVSSGAVAAGMKKLGLKEKPKDIRLKQAAAAVGQSSLMWAYEKSFSDFKKKVAQVLLTREDFSERSRYLNSKNTIITLLSYGIIPIINENDTVATDEIKFGDNDHLAALVSGLVDAERLIILSDVEGLYSSDPNKNPDAKIIPFVNEITSELEAMAGGAGSIVGTGGMYSKILAAKKAVSYGIKVNIISGRKKGLIVSLLRGIHYGTEFKPHLKRISSRKGWIAYAIKPKGSLIIDDGAVNAILKAGKSLLPSGIVKVDGVFDIGDAVYCVDIRGKRIAKGIVNYSSHDTEKIKGKKTSEIEPILGYKYSDEVVHRDNLVLLASIP
ncbi:glutamate 5-kinase [Dissulfurispira thermophila]|uniref:Glutamate 5-kinase n=2 Tax=root TaxID=1 RepID=A0A7G1H326_9BACT|nr:glutamate 5-kinase [Dissulfurispira thermophila]BCB96127.1 glutamate 5-kinase [Dissulfurispira thermophila]